MADWYPNNLDARVAWHTNFGSVLPGFADKYNISASDLLAATHDQAWMESMGIARHNVTAFAQSVTKYFNDIAGNDPTLNPPEPFSYNPINPGEERPPGIEFRTRAIARQIKGHLDYSEADGEKLGIVPPDSAISLAPPTAEVFAAQSNFQFSVVVTGRGPSDQWECMVRPVGATAWHSMGSRTGKSSDFTYVPDAASQADEPTPVQLQVRVQLKKNNANMNPPSDIVLATVNP